jgi:serine/threonine-protein kinase
MRMKHVAAHVAGGTAAAAAAVMLTVAPANAADQWAAIAYSPATGAWGWVNDADSAPIARNVSLKSCIDGGGTDCEVLTEVQNGCVSLAETETQVAVGTGTNTAAAEHNASAALGGIVHIVFSTCSGYMTGG